MKRDIKTRQCQYQVKFWSTSIAGQNNEPNQTIYYASDNIEELVKECVDYILRGSFYTRKYFATPKQAPCIYVKSSSNVVITDTYLFSPGEQKLYGEKFFCYTYQILKQ
jgi:hypothetical protein